MLVVLAGACRGPIDGSKSPDQQLAEALVPQASDFPDGWVEVSKTRRGRMPCLPGATGLMRTATVGPGGQPIFFRNTRQDQLAAESQTFLTEAQAATAFRRDAARSVASCLAGGLYKILARSMVPSDMAVVGEPSVGPLQLGTVGDESMAYQVAISIATPQRTITLYFDYAVLRVRRGVGLIRTASVMQPVDSALIESLMASTADRAAQTASA
jgi:hypothetical protein